MTLTTRLTTPEDVPALRNILNAIIATGGTTAHEDHMSEAEFRAHYFDDPAIVHTVLQGDTPAGFQALFAKPDDVASVGTFTNQDTPVPGAGRALIAASIAAARAYGFKAIIAKIRADNVPGLEYYGKMGFVDYDVETGVPLQDGTPVDRVIKRMLLDS